MTDYRQETTLNAPALVEAYWHRLRRGMLIPYRSEVDPRAIEAALPYAFIAEKVAPGHVRLRIAGTHLNELMGMEVRGLPLSALFDLAARDRLKALLEGIFTTPALARLSLSAPGGFRRPGLSARVVMLPMRNDMGDVTRLLGCLESSTSGPTGRAPRRFRIDSAEAEPLTAPEAASPAPVPEGLSPALQDTLRRLAPPGLSDTGAPETSDPLQIGVPEGAAPGFAEPITPFKSAAPSRQAPYLRLVKSD